MNFQEINFEISFRVSHFTFAIPRIARNAHFRWLQGKNKFPRSKRAKEISCSIAITRNYHISTASKEQLYLAIVCISVGVLLEIELRPFNGTTVRRDSRFYENVRSWRVLSTNEIRAAAPIRCQCHGSANLSERSLYDSVSSRSMDGNTR